MVMDNGIEYFQCCAKIRDGPTVKTFPLLIPASELYCPMEVWWAQSGNTSDIEVIFLLPSMHS
jgi:hypothetical protein